MLGFSFIQPRSKAFEHFLNRKKNIRSNGTGMVLNEKIFKIIEFPESFLLKSSKENLRYANKHRLQTPLPTVDQSVGAILSSSHLPWKFRAIFSPRKS